MKEWLTESAFGSWSIFPENKGVLNLTWGGKGDLWGAAGHLHTSIPCGTTSSFWRSLLTVPWGPVVAWLLRRSGYVCTGTSQCKLSGVFTSNSTKEYKISCFSPKLLSLAKELIRMMQRRKAKCLMGHCGVGRQGGDSLSPGTPHVCLGRSSRGHGPCYPPLGSVHLSPQGITYLISHKTCMTSKAHVSWMRWNIFQSVKKTS